MKIFQSTNSASVLFSDLSFFIITDLVEKLTYSLNFSQILLMWFLISIDSLKRLLMTSCLYVSYFWDSKVHVVDIGLFCSSAYFHLALCLAHSKYNVNIILMVDWMNPLKVQVDEFWVVLNPFCWNIIFLYPFGFVSTQPLNSSIYSIWSSASWSNSVYFSGVTCLWIYLGEWHKLQHII